MSPGVSFQQGRLWLRGEMSAWKTVLLGFLLATCTPCLHAGKNRPLPLEMALRLHTEVTGRATTPETMDQRLRALIRLVQAVDDTTGRVLASSSTLEQSLKGDIEGKKKSETAKIIGEAVGKKLVAAGVVQAVFDRNVTAVAR